MDEVISIPSKVAAPGSPPSEFPKSENLALDPEVVAKVQAVAKSNLIRWKSGVDQWWEDVGKKADEMFRAENKTSKTQNDDTEADLGNPMFWRVVRIIASGIASLVNQRKCPVSFTPIYSNDAFYKSEEGQQQADQHNLLIQWTMREDELPTRLTEMIWQAVKYGSLPFAVTWKHKKQRIKDRMPVRNEEGTITGYKFTNKEVVTKNFPSLQSIPPENFFTDLNGGDIQKKPGVIVRDFVCLDDILTGQRNGLYANADKVKIGHMYRGANSSTATDDKYENMGETAPDRSETGQFEVWRCFLRLPITDDGQWSDDAEPKIYWAEFVGDLVSGNAVCLKIVRNPDPDDELPYKVINVLPDDPEMLYHMSYAKIIESYFDESTTTTNQAIDQKSQLVRRPLKAVMGEVYTDDLTFLQDKVYWVDNQNSISDFSFPNMFNDTIQAREYLDTQIDRAIGTDKPIAGEAMGGRTSASEAVNIFNQAMKPGVALADYFLQQLLPWWAKKAVRNWHLYALKGQVLEVTGGEARTQIKPAELYGMFDVETDIVTEFVDEGTAMQNLQYMATQLVANPAIVANTDMQEFTKLLYEKMRLTKNPARLLKASMDWDADYMAQVENAQLTNPAGGVMVFPEKGQNHEAHMRAHKSLREQYRNHPQEKDLAGFIDAHIEATKFMMEQEAMQQSAPPAAPNAPGLPGEVRGDQIAAKSGARTGRPPMAESA